MKRKAYSAGAVKFSFWFIEFRKVVQLLAAGNDYKEIKRLSEEENIFGASTPARAAMICSTTTARAKALDPSFVPLLFKKFSHINFMIIRAILKFKSPFHYTPNFKTMLLIYMLSFFII